MRYQRLILVVPCVAFLLMPSDAWGQRRYGAAGGVRGGAVAGPYGGSASRMHGRETAFGPGGSSLTATAGKGSYTTNRGTTIDYAGAGRKATGPGGGTAAGGIGGVQVDTASGKQYTKVGRAGGAVGPEGNAVAGRSSVGVATGPGGTAVNAKRGGVAVGPGGAVAGGRHGGAAAGPYGAAGYASRWGAVAGTGTHYVSGGTLQARGAYVRRGYVHTNVFTPNWYAGHRSAWRAANWTTANFWAAASWATIAATCRYPAQPVVYDYGTTIVYQGDQVLYNAEAVATPAEYAAQATQLAATGAEASPPATDEWIPLGVFAMVQGDNKDANTIFQLAINKEGIIRGNYYDALTDTTLPVTGAVDKRTQRAAWTVSDRKGTVYETGIANLSQPETSMLIHFGKDRTQQWTLVRLEKPE